MTHLPLSSLALSFGLAVLAGTAAQAATVPPGTVGYTLGDNGTTLLTIPDLNRPGVADARAITDGAGRAVALHGIAYRPMDGGLYGYSDLDDSTYRIDPMTGVATRQATSAAGTSTRTIDLDFNHQIDAARVVSGADENIVYRPRAMPQDFAPPATALAYAADDANAGTDPEIFANAYTNQVVMASSTLQYGLDSGTDSLVTIANNAGTLRTVGQLWFRGAAFDVSSDGGLDIFSPVEGVNFAYAALTSVLPDFAGPWLFGVPLAADGDGRVNVELIGALPRDRGQIDGLVVAPAPVPLPATALLLGGALGAMGVWGRRRKTA